MGWDVARNSCQADAPPSTVGDLASIPDEATNAFLVDLITQDLGDLVRDGVEGKPFWVGGQKVGMIWWYLM